MRGSCRFGHRGVVRLLLNLVWLVFGGLVLVIGYRWPASICCLLVVTIPFGIAAFRIALYALWPFGRPWSAGPTPASGRRWATSSGSCSPGWWITLGHLIAGVALCCTIIGIPLGLAHFKLMPVSLMPLGKEIVQADMVY